MTEPIRPPPPRPRSPPPPERSRGTGWSPPSGRSLTLLRLSLGAVFVWFGALKIAGVTPVADLVAGTVPWLDRAGSFPPWARSRCSSVLP